MLQLPSINHTKYNPEHELPILKLAITNYFKSVMMTKTEIKAVFTLIDKDPFEFGESDCKSICKFHMPGKRYELTRTRCIATENYFSNNQ